MSWSEMLRASDVRVGVVSIGIRCKRTPLQLF